MAASSVEPPSFATKSNEEKLSDGILLLLKPSIESLDEKVAKIKKSQAELNSSITLVGEGLHGIADNLPNPQDLDPHIKRLANARRKVNIINSILSNCQERLRKLHANIHKDNYRREQALTKGSTKQSTTQQQSASQSPNNTPVPPDTSPISSATLAANASASTEHLVPDQSTTSTQNMPSDEQTSQSHSGEQLEVKSEEITPTKDSS